MIGRLKLYRQHAGFHGDSRDVVISSPRSSLVSSERAPTQRTPWSRKLPNATTSQTAGRLGNEGGTDFKSLTTDVKLRLFFI